MPKPSKYVNRVVRLGKLIVLCNKCLHILSRGRSRGKYSLEGVSMARCEWCCREVDSSVPRYRKVFRLVQ